MDTKNHNLPEKMHRSRLPLWKSMTVGKAKCDGRVAGGSVQISLRVKTPGRLPRFNELPLDALPGSHSEGLKKNPLLLQKGGWGKTATIDYPEHSGLFNKACPPEQVFHRAHLPGFYQSLIHLGEGRYPAQPPLTFLSHLRGKEDEIKLRSSCEGHSSGAQAHRLTDCDLITGLRPASPPPSPSMSLGLL